MHSRQEGELMDACRILFPAVEISRDFLWYIQSDGLKNAFRSRARECHPDACGENAGQARRTELFRRSVEAYRLLDKYLKVREPAITLVNRQAREAKAFARRSPAQRPRSEQYYTGPFPGIHLKLGLYLYYRGIVSYQEVVRAMIWQRDMRPPLGDFARRWGWLSEEDVSVILAATEIVGSFGERAMALGLLTQSQLNLLLLHQRSMQQPIGRYFVSRSLLSELSLRQHLRDLARHNATVSASRR